MTEAGGAAASLRLQPLRESTMKMDLARYIIDAVDRYWAEDVQTLGAWQD